MSLFLDGFALTRVFGLGSSADLSVRLESCEFQKYVTNVDRPLGRGHSKSRKTTEYKEVFGTRPRNNKRKSVDLESNSEAGTLVDTVEAPAKKARKQAPVKVEEEEALPASTRPRREVRSVVVVKEEVQVETKPAPKRKVKVEQEEESDEEDFEVGFFTG